MSKKDSRRDFLQKLMSAGTTVAASGFYSTLLNSTKAVASDDKNQAANLAHKEFLDKMSAASEEIDPRALWAFKDGGDGDKYGGPMEEPDAKKK